MQICHSSLLTQVARAVLLLAYKQGFLLEQSHQLNS